MTRSAATTRAGKRVCSALRVAWRRASGRLSHQAMTGEPSHRSRIGPATSSTAGVDAASTDRRRNGDEGPHPHGPESTGELILAGPGRDAVHLARRIPFQQAPIRDEDAPERADDGIQTEEGLVRKTGELERHLLDVSERRTGDRAEVLPIQHFVRLAEHVEERNAQGGNELHADHGQRPQPGRRQDRPSQQQQEQQRGGNQTAAQVVDQLPLRQGRERVRLPRVVRAGTLFGTARRYSPPQPAGQLPVAANPAVPPAHIRAVAGGMVLDQQHVAQQSGAGITAFEKVVAQDSVLGEASAKRMLEGIDVVNPLADERALAEHVLIDIRDGARIRVDAWLAAIKSGEARAVRPRQADGHARLHDAVALGDQALRFVVAGAIQRMAHGGDELPRRVARQLGVGVQGNDVFDIGQGRNVADDQGKRLPDRRPAVARSSRPACPACARNPSRFARAGSSAADGGTGRRRRAAAGPPLRHIFRSARLSLSRPVAARARLRPAIPAPHPGNRSTGRRTDTRRDWPETSPPAPRRAPRCRRRG